jgi:hypothetical protein
VVIAAAQAACSEPTSWPDALIIVAGIIAFCWVMGRVL